MTKLTSDTPNLPEQAKSINQYINKAECSARSAAAAAAAAAAGIDEIFNIAKEQAQHGQWKGWLAK